MNREHGRAEYFKPSRHGLRRQTTQNKGTDLKLKFELKVEANTGNKQEIFKVQRRSTSIQKESSESIC